MIEKEEERQPWELIPAELRCPEKGKEKWFEDVVARQLLGIENDYRPRLLRGMSEEQYKTWHGGVWMVWVNLRPLEERRAIMDTTEPGREFHTRPFGRDDGERSWNRD